SRSGGLAAAAGSAAAAATAASTGLVRRASPAADRDRGQQLDRVIMPLRAGRGRGRLAHRTALLKGVSAGTAAVFVAGHGPHSTWSQYIRRRAIGSHGTSSGGTSVPGREPRLVRHR